MERMAGVNADNKTRDLWKEVKKTEGRKIPKHVSVGGALNHADISHMFDEKYKTLYISTPCYTNRMNDIQQEINERLKNGIMTIMENVIKNMGKSHEGEYSNHITNRFILYF